MSSPTHSISIPILAEIMHKSEDLVRKIYRSIVNNDCVPLSQIPPEHQQIYAHEYLYRNRLVDFCFLESICDYLTELEQYYAVRFEPPVRAKLISICSDRMNGGLGNFIEVLEFLFSTERPEWKEISYQIIRDTNRILHTHSDPIQIPSYVVCEDQPSEKSMDVFAEECDPPAEDPHPRIDVSKLPVVTITRSSINDALRHKMGR